MSLQYLTKLRKNALQNAAKQKRKIEAGKNVRVYPEYWLNAAKDYANQIKALSAKKS